jgi:hypothetical protein
LCPQDLPHNEPLPETNLPVLPDPFPDHARKSYPRLSYTSMRDVYLCLTEIKLWIFGGTHDACPQAITRELLKWKAQVLKDLDTFQAYNKLDKASTERAALVYAFEVLLLNSLKDSILKDGQEGAATTLSVGAIPGQEHYCPRSLTQKRLVHRTQT